MYLQISLSDDFQKCNSCLLLLIVVARVQQMKDTNEVKPSHFICNFFSKDTPSLAVSGSQTELSSADLLRVIHVMMMTTDWCHNLFLLLPFWLLDLSAPTAAAAASTVHLPLFTNLSLYSHSSQSTWTCAFLGFVFYTISKQKCDCVVYRHSHPFSSPWC